MQSLLQACAKYMYAQQSKFENLPPVPLGTTRRIIVGLIQPWYLASIWSSSTKSHAGYSAQCSRILCIRESQMNAQA